MKTDSVESGQMDLVISIKGRERGGVQTTIGIKNQRCSDSAALHNHVVETRNGLAGTSLSYTGASAQSGCSAWNAALRDRSRSSYEVRGLSLAGAIVLN